MYNLAEINPSIWFLIVWGIISWLSDQKKKKKKQIQNDSAEESKPSDLHERLQRLKDHMASELDFFPNNETVPVVEEPVIDLDVDEIEEDEDSFANELSEIKNNPPVQRATVKKKFNFRSSNLKQAIIFKEILDKPRALKPITDDW